MDRRALVTATLLMAALVFALPSIAAEVEDEVKVLLLPDRLGAGTDALVAALEADGCSVMVGPIEYLWNGTNPGTWGFDVVVHLNGATYEFTPPISGQLALVDFVGSGGGYVSSQWNGYEVWDGRLNDMDDLVLQLWPSLDWCVGCLITWTVVPGLEDHPVLEGILGPITFFAEAHDPGPLVVFDEFPSVVLMTSPSGEPAVTVREFEGGRVVALGFAANYLSGESVPVLTLEEPMIQQLYVNAVSWAAPLESAPTIEDLVAAVIELRELGAINKGQANGLINKLEGVSRQIDRGNFKVARNHMGAFVKKLEALVTPELSTPLVEMANAIIARLPG